MIKINNTIVSIFNLAVLFFAFFINSSNAVESPVTKPITSFCTGFYHNCAIFETTSMKCLGEGVFWGANGYTGRSESELGDAIPSVDVGTNAVIEQVACGSFHTCTRLATGDVKCMGVNGNGQVGAGLSQSVVGSMTGISGDNLPAANIGSDLLVLDVATGREHTCVKVTGNKVKCFGKNQFGLLGYGDTKDRGRSSSDMGDNLPFVDLGTGVEVASIHSGVYAQYNCAILSMPSSSSQKMKCWGSNSEYQLGYGDTNHRGDNLYEMGDNLTLVDLGTESRVKHVALGENHSCALLLSNVLKCWGYGGAGAIGSGSYSPITSTGDSMPSVLIDSGETVMQVATAHSHTCIMYDDQVTVKCFGINDFGQLGIGDKTSRGYLPTTTVPYIPVADLGTGSLKISSIHVGFSSNCIIFIDDSVKCFGENMYGELGIGSTKNIGDEPYEMGSNLTFAKFFSPTTSPTSSPTHNPTNSPSRVPTKSPSKNPTISPTTYSPTSSPTFPTKSPTRSPTTTPSKAPTNSPSKPTSAPKTQSPSEKSSASINQPLDVGVGIGIPVFTIVAIIATLSIY